MTMIFTIQQRETKSSMIFLGSVGFMVTLKLYEGFSQSSRRGNQNCVRGLVNAVRGGFNIVENLAKGTTKPPFHRLHLNRLD